MKKMRRLTVLIFTIWVMFTGTIMSVEPFSLDRVEDVVSFEYLTTCPRCGDSKMEGYHSLVDGYTFENCKNCLYHFSIGPFNK